MKKVSLAISLLICSSATVHSKNQTPQVLFRAAQCLAVKNFLPSAKETGLTFGYLLDEKSYPGDKVIYLVKYAAPARSNGLIFAIFLTEHADRQDFNIQNNASFVLSKDDISRVDFVNPPLGGTSTQEHLALAIKRIENKPRFVISAKDLFAVDPSIRCESYTDPPK